MMSTVIATMRSAFLAGCFAVAASGSCGGETDAPGGNSETNFGNCKTDDECDPGERCVAQKCQHSPSGDGADAEPVADAGSPRDAASPEGSSDGTPATEVSCETRSLGDCESEPACHLIYLRPIDVENGCLEAPAPAFCKERFQICPSGPIGCQHDDNGDAWFSAPCGEFFQEPSVGHPCRALFEDAPGADGGAQPDAGAAGQTADLPTCGGVSEPYPICLSMLEDATQAMNRVLEDAPGCAVDEDCMKFSWQLDCANFCIAFTEAGRDALVDPLSLAASECAGYEIAGCEPAVTPCDAQTPARCVEGRCEP